MKPSIIRDSLGKYWISVVVASFLVLVMAISSSAMGVLIGPCLRLLFDGGHAAAEWVDLVGPVIGKVFTVVSGNTGLDAGGLWQQIPLWLLMLASIKAVSTLAQWFMWERISEKIARDLRRGIVERFLRLDPEQRSERNHGGESRIASALSTDIKYVQELVLRYYGGLPREALVLLFYGVTLWALSPKLLAIFAFAVLPAVLVVGNIGKRLRRRATEALNNVAELTEWLQQRLLGIETIKFYKTEAGEAERLSQLNLQLFRRHQAAARVKSRAGPAMETIAIIAMAAVIWLAGREISLGRISPSVCLSFFATLGLLSQAAGKLGKYVNVSKEGHAALNRLVELHRYLDSARSPVIQLPVELAANQEPATVSVAGVSFRYDASLPWVLRQLTLHLTAGKIYAICGSSGAGKSTLFKMLLGLAKPTEGLITLRVPPGQQRSASGLVGFVPQQIELFSGSLAQNIAFPNAQFDGERIQEILRELRLSEALESEAATSAIDADETLTLSGGQAQRVMLGRIFYHQPPFVLIDEGTSALDPETEALIHRGLRQIANSGAVVIMISHRYASTRLADEVVLLDRGEVAFQGTPAEAEAHPVFRKVLALQ